MISVRIDWNATGAINNTAREKERSHDNINRVILTGNLTADPELRALPSGTSVGRLRLAVNTRRKNGQTGEWEEKPNYFDVTVWGAQAENCAQYLAKGRPVAVDGRLEWREYTTQDGQKRQAVEVIAENVQFLASREQNGNRGGSRRRGRPPPRRATPATSTHPCRQGRPATTTSRSERDGSRVDERALPQAADTATAAPAPGRALLRPVRRHRPSDPAPRDPHPRAPERQAPRLRKAHLPAANTRPTHDNRR